MESENRYGNFVMCDVRAHILASVSDDGILEVIADQYDNQGWFDDDRFEERILRIECPANKGMWVLAYRIARTLVRKGSVNILGLNGQINVGLGDLVTISEGV